MESLAWDLRAVISITEILVLSSGEPPQWDGVGQATNITCLLLFLLYLMVTVNFTFYAVVLYLGD